MFVKDGVVLPEPTIRHRKRRRMISRDDAWKILQAVDDAGFGCTLAAGTDGERRGYQVIASLDKLSGEDLSRLLGAMSLLPDTAVSVDESLLIAS